HDGQHRGDTVQQAFDIDVDHSIPFFDLEGRHGGDRHDSGIVNDDVDPVVLPKRALHQRLDLVTLGHVGLEAGGVAACLANVPDQGIDPIHAPRPEHDL